MKRIPLIVAAIAAGALVVSPLVAATPAIAATQAVLIASPTGSGTVCSVAAPCSLAGAQAAARALIPTMTGDIEVQLRGGTYALSAPIVLTQDDSGRNGFRTIYRSYPGETPVLSGGQPITGWALEDAGLNIYAAAVPAGFSTRQLYVNGVRATRARTPINPSGFTWVEATGFTTTNTAMQNWRNPDNIEIVDYVTWRAYRCGVASISGTAITMDQPCWANAKRHDKMSAVTWVENAYELLDQPGEWYLDESLDEVYYIPRPGEDLGTAAVIASSTESLLEVAGTGTDPVEDITITGLTFAYNTWMRPSTPEGHPSLQAGFLYTTGTESDPHTAARDLLKTPAAVTITGGHDVLLERNTFTHLGSAGVNLEAGTQNTVIRGNVFTDISAGAVQVGHINDSHPTTAAATVLDNEVSNNYIQDVAVEYQGSVGIWAGYTDGTRILHNEISRLPYTGISIGWGWGCVDPGGPCGFPTPSASKDNEVAYNLIQDFMLTLTDGGGIYTLGLMAGTTVHDNFVTGMPNAYGALYLDEKSTSIAMTGNVVAAAYRWYHDNSKSTNTLTGNWSTTDRAVPASTPVAGNQTGLFTWPAGAAAVVEAAGLEAAYAGIRPAGAATGDLAAGKPAVASSEYSSANAAGKAFDGQAGTGWSPVAPATDPRPWVQVDLGARYQISRVQLVTRQGNPDYPETRQDFEIRASNDPGFSTYVVLGSQGSTPLAHQATWSKASPFATGVGYQYIRAVKTTDAYFYVNDLRVFGTPARVTNVAFGKTATASSTFDASTPASNAVNGSVTTAWSPAAPATDPRPWVQVDLGAKHQISWVEFVTRQNADQPATRQDFELRASNDPTFATYTVLGSQGSTPLAHASTWTSVVADPGAYRYIRLTKTVDAYFYVAELRVYGSAADPANLAMAKPTSASSVYDAGSVHANAVDGQIATGWSPVAPATDPRPWLQVDLGGTFRLGSVELVTRQNLDQAPTRQDFEIRASNDPTFATYTVLAAQGSTPLAYKATLSQALGSSAPFRYIRIIKTVDAYFYAAELRAYQ